MHNKIPVCHNIQEVKAFLNKIPDAKFCLYLAFKTEEEWEKSTSKIYMNQVSKQLVYLPVNIKKDDQKMLESIYQLSEEMPQVVAVNHTQPHKSNSVLRAWFKGQKMPTTVDALVKDHTGKLQLYDLNGPSFTNWFEAEVGNFKDKQIIVLGIGGVGEPIARKTASKQPKDLFLVDIISKTPLAEELSSLSAVSYVSRLDVLPPLSEKIIFINCAGKEGVSETGLMKFLEKYKQKENVFIDVRPQLNIEVAKKARQLGWKSYTGFGMNARNDYMLLLKICSIVKMIPLSFKNFKRLVEEAS